MPPIAFARWLLPLSLTLLSACSQTPRNLNLEADTAVHCPLSMQRGQELSLSLRSNPSTGFRWEIKEAANGVLKSLGPEVYSHPEDAGLVGSAGQSTWRFKAEHAGNGRLLMVYQQPWEPNVVPARTFDCQIEVQ
ncbi:MAG: protease inhibitor I42 family protein [Pseudomonas sp.]|nr:protease inhibitor I42 family protein [Pseudomonas sp.]